MKVFRAGGRRFRVTKPRKLSDAAGSSKLLTNRTANDERTPSERATKCFAHSAESQAPLSSKQTGIEQALWGRQARHPRSADVGQFTALSRSLHGAAGKEVQIWVVLIWTTAE